MRHHGHVHVVFAQHRRISGVARSIFGTRMIGCVKTIQNHMLACFRSKNWFAWRILTELATMVLLCCYVTFLLWKCFDNDTRHAEFHGNELTCWRAFQRTIAWNSCAFFYWNLSQMSYTPHVPRSHRLGYDQVVTSAPLSQISPDTRMLDGNELS